MLITTDASIYEIKPKRVCYPKNRSDLIKIVRDLLAKKQSFTMRAGGTSIAGQAIGKGVLIDVSKHLTRIIDFQEEKREITVEPGVIQDDLNSFLKSYGLKFAPDTSTSNRAMIGGMVGNNSCGSYSIYYGTTRDHIKSVEVILSDGSLVEFKELNESELYRKLSLKNLEGDIYRFVINLLKGNHQEILDSYPDEDLIRRNTGYALDELIRKHKPFNLTGKPFNLAPLLCGSEGTLGVITNVKLNLVKLPEHRELVVAHFSSCEQPLGLVKDLIRFKPSAIEYIDAPTLDASKNNPEQQKNRVWIEGNPEAILVIEFFSDSLEEITTSLNLCRDVLLSNGAYNIKLIEKHDVDKVWNVRKSGLGLLMGEVGPKKAIAIIEDVAVPVSSLKAYFKEIRALMQSYGVDAVYYGHASVGLIHIRPKIDTSDAGGKNKALCIARDVSKIVKKYRGSLSGEHGDGRVRAPFLKEQFGSTVYQYLVDLKNTFDPSNLLNPGVIISENDLLTGLRPVVAQQDISTFYNWKHDISVFYAAEKCNGAGTCRKSIGGIMCPSYRATRDERFSPRGRANLLRRALQRKNPKRRLRSKEIKQALDLCLSCKACKVECQANVDIAKLKSEYLFQTNNILDGFRLWHIKNLSSILKIGSKLPSVFNFVQGCSPARKLFGYYRELPLLEKETLDVWLNTKRLDFNADITVWVAVDIYTQYYDSSSGKDVLRFLEMCDINVRIVYLEDSIPAMISHGLLKEVKSKLEFLSSALSKAPETNFILAIEPSEALIWRDEVKDFIDIENVPEVLMFEELVLKLKKLEVLPKFNAINKKVWIYEHCHQKLVTGSDNLVESLALIPGLEVERINSGCCGMAGDFGYKYPKVSEKIARNSLEDYVNRMQKEDLLIATGVSCRKQILDIFHIRSVHSSNIFMNSAKAFNVER